MTPRVALVFAIVLCAATAGAQRAALGRITFPNSGPAAAQDSFIRGVLLLHSFEYDDAIAAFREAQKIAPGFAMAYWGEAMCYNQPLWRNENVVRAREVLKRLGPDSQARAAKAPTPREKGYLDAVERLFGDGDRSVRNRAYVERMRALRAANPNDHEAALFYALALLSTIPEGERNAAVSLEAGGIGAGILKINPEHPGAAHIVLHAYDDGEHNRLALDAARIYAKIAPSSSHALHMPSHAFLPLGMWDEAAASDERSFAASVAWVKRTGRPESQTDFHPLSWLHYEYLQQGRFAKAREAEEPLRRALASASTSTSTNHQTHVESEIGRGYGAMSLRNELASMRARYVVESRDWTLMKGQGNFDNIDELFAVGLTASAHGDFGRADAAIDQLRKAAATLGDRDLHEVAAIMADQLLGVVQFARGKQDEGLASLARATAAEGKRPRPIARPYPIKPAAELYGEFLLGAGRPREAIAQFQAALKRTPRRPASLFALASALAADGNQKEATAVARQFIAIWHRADAGRKELSDMQALAKGPP